MGVGGDVVGDHTSSTAGEDLGAIGDDQIAQTDRACGDDGTDSVRRAVRSENQGTALQVDGCRANRAKGIGTREDHTSGSGKVQDVRGARAGNHSINDEAVWGEASGGDGAGRIVQGHGAGDSRREAEAVVVCDDVAAESQEPTRGDGWGGVTSGVIEGQSAAQGVGTGIGQRGTTIEDDVGTVMDGASDGLRDSRVVEGQRAVGNRDRGTAVRTRGAEGEGALVDDGIARACAERVVACQGETTGTRFDQAEASAAGDHTADGRGVGVDVSKQFRTTGGEAAAVDGEGLVGRHEETAGAEGEGVGGGDVDGRRGARVDAE